MTKTRFEHFLNLTFFFFVFALALYFKLIKRNKKEETEKSKTL